MARNAEQIREEIEQTRGQLGQTLEAIGDRVSPRHVVEDLAEKVSPRRLVRRQTEKVKEGISNMGDTMKSKASSAVNGSAASDRGSLPKPLPRTKLEKPNLPKPALPSVDGPRVEAKTRQKASEIKGEVAERAQGVSGKVREVSASAVEQVRSAPENAPLIAGAVAFGAGLAVALAVRPSAQERRVASSVGNGVASPLRARATRLKENVRAELEPKVKGGVDRVKRSAAGARARVKAEAADATADVKTEIADAAGEVKRGTRNLKSVAKSEVKQKVAAKKLSRPPSTGKPSTRRKAASTVSA